MLLSQGIAEDSDDGKKNDQKKIVLQLKWYHQFQFAGYYAALEKGFYSAEGLDVEIVEGAPEQSALQRMLNGEADFCVAASGAIVSRMKGKPTVACAAIFQHSPFVLITDKESGIRTPADLVGRKVAISKAAGTVQFRAMMKRVGLSLDMANVRQGHWHPDELLDGTVDAISGYSTTQAPMLRSQGVDPFLIDPADYGIDFYGDILCTTEKFAKEDQATTEAMTRASLRGWQYAMDHPDEIIDLILTLPGVKERGKQRQQLKLEADMMRSLVVPEIIEIGHMNPERWERIALAYQEAGLARIPDDPTWLNEFIFKPKGELTLANLRFAGILVAAIGVLVLVIFVWNTILQRRVEKATSIIREQSILNELLLDTAMDAVIGVGRDGRIVRWSGQAEEVFQIEKENAEGKPIDQFLPGLLSQIDRDKEAIRLSCFDLEARRSDGDSFPVELSVSSIPGNFEVWLNVFVRDVANHRELEEKLRQSQKMQAIGQLAGGIAHDFNNLLIVISGNVDLLSQNLRPEDEHFAKEIVDATDRVAELTGQLLAFSRQQPMQKQLVKIDTCMASFGKILERLIGEDIALDFKLNAEQACVVADPAMLEQVILNLAVNSRDAMPHGGTLTVETCVALDIERGDETVKIRVIDSGTGIAHDKLTHIFEPFYTTKEVGKGTGLGLATAFGIVEQHGGEMKVESREGEGCTFTVILPRATDDLSGISTGRQSVEPKHSSGGAETIFLVEDEAMVRAVAGKILSKHGYRIIEAESGAEALDVWDQHRNDIDLLLTDIVMPGGVCGHKLATVLQTEKPELPVIYASGYSAEVFRGELEFPDGAVFLAKPYSPKDLLKRVRETLDEPIVLPR